MPELFVTLAAIVPVPVIEPPLRIIAGELRVPPASKVDPPVWVYEGVGEGTEEGTVSVDNDSIVNVPLLLNWRNGAKFFPPRIVKWP